MTETLYQTYAEAEAALAAMPNAQQMHTEGRSVDGRPHNGPKMAARFAIVANRSASENDRIARALMARDGVSDLGRGRERRDNTPYTKAD